MYYIIIWLHLVGFYRLLLNLQACAVRGSWSFCFRVKAPMATVLSLVFFSCSVVLAVGISCYASVPEESQEHRCRSRPHHDCECCLVPTVSDCRVRQLLCVSLMLRHLRHKAYRDEPSCRHHRQSCR